MVLRAGDLIIALWLPQRLEATVTVVGTIAVHGRVFPVPDLHHCQLTDCFGQCGGPDGGHLGWLAVVADRVREEPARTDRVSPLRRQHVDELAVVIDGASRRNTICRTL